ncbi:MAG: mannose-1-phosphate guanylyltransferase/mannose-6-phosphate isomerase, partial [Proteobacteria bacterium]|nr:mannose-1-phosphate guanylyltransferase/mannose-6-phosphate isomerase [Pseudomonadota bacterium]
PVILSGGSGTRLWPLSQPNYPKPFLPLNSRELSLIQQTALRVRSSAFHPPLVVCKTEHGLLAAEQFSALGMAPMFLLEPHARNTAPAITAAALLIEEVYGAAIIMLVLPSDHVITDVDAFQKAVAAACAAAEKGDIVTFGIKPSYAETGYGYIHKGSVCDKRSELYSVKSFTEKPDVTRAKAYISSGEYLWNSGMCMVSAGTFLSEMQKHHPLLLAQTKAAFHNRQDIVLGEEPYMEMQSISVDYALLEKSKKVVTLALDCGWSDVGTWRALAHVPLSPARVEDKAIATVNMLGIKNVITDVMMDSPLIMEESRSLDLRQFAKQMRKHHDDNISTLRTERPWGFYEQLHEGTCYKVKYIRVNPKAKLSLQQHRYRAEHWVVLKGQARIILEEQDYDVVPYQSFSVPAGKKHRLENKGTTPLEIIEVQIGTYLGEDDIVRFDDAYDRCSELR